MEKTTDYIGNFVYKNSSLKMIITDDGRLLPDSTGFAYEYFIKVEAKLKSRYPGKRLGNTLVSVQDSLGYAIVEQEDHYYPFGMRMDGLSFTAQSLIDKGTENKYLYNGKELQDDLGLDWYDYGARFYDAQLAQFVNIDPKSEKYYSYSPYNYVGGNPIRRIDRNGEDWVDGKGKLIYDPSKNGGKGDYTDRATKQDRMLGNSLRLTKTGRGQFAKLVAPGQKTQVLLDKKSRPKDKDGQILGFTNNVKDGGKTDISFDFATGKKEADVKASVITLYSANVKDLEQNTKGGGESEMGNATITRDMSLEDLLGIVLGHEIEHTTDENMTLNILKKDTEKKPTAISDTMINELKKQKEEEKK